MDMATCLTAPLMVDPVEPPIHAAFSSPVHDTQQCFRAALGALAEPGHICYIPALPCTAPSGLPAGLYALCLTLFDTDTPVWLSPRFRHPAIQTNLAFHTGCPFTDDRATAAACSAS